MAANPVEYPFVYPFPQPLHIVDDDLRGGHPYSPLAPSLERRLELQDGLAAESATDIYNRPKIRSATLADVEALANVELGAYKDVYGAAPSEETIDSVRKKYQERLELLEGFVNVLDDDDHGVYGMIVCCRTDLSRDELLASNYSMTNNDTLRNIHTPNGRNGYIVNLATLPGVGDRRDGLYLATETIRWGRGLGVQSVFFESRLPGFERWRQRQCEEANRAGSPTPDTQQLAEIYWQSTRSNGKPLDKLMRLYSDEIGGHPLKLIPNAWEVDEPSNGYGVLYELELNPAVGVDTATSLDVPEQVAITPLSQAEGDSAATEPSLAALITVDGKPDGVHFFRKALEWAKTHVKLIAQIGSAAVGLAYVFATGGEGQIIQRLQGKESWVLPAYIASLAMYLAGWAVMGAAGGKRAIDNRRSRRGGHSSEAQEQRNENTSLLFRAGLWMNTVGGVSAAAVAGIGIVESVPFGPGWSLLSVPTIDLYSTVALRAPVFRMLRERRQRTTAAMVSAQEATR